MDVTLTEAEKQLPELIQVMERGEPVIITRNGRPVAQLSPPPTAEVRKPRLGTMRGQIQYKPGWDEPIDLDQFSKGEF